MHGKSLRAAVQIGSCLATAVPAACAERGTPLPGWRPAWQPLMQKNLFPFGGHAVISIQDTLRVVLVELVLCRLRHKDVLKG